MASRTSIISNYELSCGIRLISQLDAGKFQGLSVEENAAKVVRMVARKRFGILYKGDNERFSTVIFSHREGDSYCEALLDLIRKKKLGKVTPSPVVQNANSFAYIQTYVWDINANNLIDFCVPEPRKPRRLTSTAYWNR